MANFETDREIEAWLAEVGHGGMLRALANGTLGGPKRQRLLEYNRRRSMEEEFAQAEQNRLLQRRAVTAQEEQARATSDQAATARTALRVAIAALCVSIFAAVIALLAYSHPE